MSPSLRARFVRWARLMFQRLPRELATAREIIRRRRAFAALALVVCLTAIHLFLVPPQERQSVFIDTTLTVLTTLTIAYVSMDYFVPYLQSSERNRIASPSQVVKYYDAPEEFVSPSRIPGWKPQLRTSAIPVVIEHTPSRPTPIDKLSVKHCETYYDFPPRISAVVQPRIEKLEELFFREGYFSTVQSRLDRIEDGVFVTEKTSYFRSFVTNFCPDYELYKGKTLRSLTQSQLFKDEKWLRPLSESPLSDHLGVAGLVITSDGSVLLSIRARAVAIDKRTKALSFSGSASHDVGGENVIRSSLLAELQEELEISEQHVQEIQYLGTVRRMERLGKPDAVAVVLVDEQATWKGSSSESAAVSCVELDTVHRIGGIDTLFNEAVAEEILNTIADELSKSPYRAEIGVLTFVYLFALHSDVSMSELCE